MKKNILFIAVVFIFSACSNTNKLTNNSGWISLFDGKSLDGWKASRGVQAEIELAIELDLPIRYLSPSMISNLSGGDTNISFRPFSQETSI